MCPATIVQNSSLYFIQQFLFRRDGVASPHQMEKRSITPTPLIPIWCWEAFQHSNTFPSNSVFHLALWAWETLWGLQELTTSSPIPIMLHVFTETFLSEISDIRLKWITKKLLFSHQTSYICYSTIPWDLVAVFSERTCAHPANKASASL